jgi:hypothetical protein
MTGQLKHRVCWECTTTFGTAEFELSENLRDFSVDIRTNAFVRCKAWDEALVIRALLYSGHVIRAIAYQCSIPYNGGNTVIDSSDCCGNMAVNCVYILAESVRHYAANRLGEMTHRRCADERRFQCRLRPVIGTT